MVPWTLVANNHSTWLAHRCIPTNQIRRKFFFLICLCHAPAMVGRKEPKILLHPLGHDRVPMFFWGPLMDQGRWTCFFISLDPDGCLAADRLKVHSTTVWKTGCRLKRRTDTDLNIVPAKMRFLFCDGEVFSLDTSLLMGATVHGFIKFKNESVTVEKVQKWQFLQFCK